MASKKVKHVPSSAPVEAVAHLAPQATAAPDFTELPARALEIGMAHMSSALDFSTRLMNTRDLDEVVSLQSGFAQKQAQSLMAQADEMNELAIRTARGIQDTFARSMKEWAKPAA
jgi:hypothetical protein